MMGDSTSKPIQFIKRRYSRRKQVFLSLFPMLLMLLLITGMGSMWFIPSVNRILFHQRESTHIDLVRSAWSIANELHQQSESGEISEEQAKRRFLRRVQTMRFGPEMKDYFWVHDLNSVIVSHPYHETIDLSTYVDKTGLKVLVEMNRKVVESTSGEAFLTYYWQHNDDPSREDLKTSFLKIFEPWGWVIGSGFYHVEAASEIAELTRNFLRWMGIATVFITILIIIAISRSLRNLRLARESETRLLSMAEHVSHGLAVLKDGTPIFCNRRMCTLLDTAYDPLTSVEQAPHHEIADFVAKNDGEVFEDSDAHENLVIGAWHRTPSGSLRYLIRRLSRNPETGEEYLVVRDWTSRKQLEMQLVAARTKAEESERLKSAFLANVSHEIRTPLNAISGLTEVIACEADSNPEWKSYRDMIVENTEILTGLMDDIIKVAQIESVSDSATIHPHEIDTILHDAIHGARKQAYIAPSPDHPIRLILDIDPEIEGKKVFTDQEKTVFILKELIDNAFKFTEKGSITVGCRCHDNDVELFVKDTGMGIPDEDKSRIFEPFFHGETQFISLHRGTGLGLNMIRRQVQLMGGSINFSSTSGQGTEFTIRGICSLIAKHP